MKRERELREREKMVMEDWQIDGNTGKTVSKKGKEMEVHKGKMHT